MKRALVIGGSLGGLFAANLLHDLGWQVEVFVRVGDRVCVDRAGRVLHRRHWGHTMSAWANVYRPLKQRFPAARYRFGKNFSRLEEKDGRICASFDDGSSAE